MKIKGNSENRCFRFQCLSLMLLLLLLSCSPTLSEKQERANKARQGKGDIIIGVVAPWEDEILGLYRQGIEMAADEINQSGGVMNRKIRLVKEDDKADIPKAQIVAQSFADNTDMVAVIGHVYSYVSIAVAMIYEYYGLLMLSPTSNASDLTSENQYRYIFRNIYTEIDYAQRMAEFAQKQGYKRLVVYSSSQILYRLSGNAFEEKVEELGCEVVARLSYDSTSEDRYFRRDLRFLKENFVFDAIFLEGYVRQAADFLVQARQMGITVPIIGGIDLVDPLLWKVGGKAVEGMVMGTPFHPDDPQPESVEFVKAFQKRFGMKPDSYAGQGYDALKLLAYAMEKANSTVPSEIADALRSTKNRMGVTGSHTFNERGDVVNKPVDMVIARKGGFEFLKE